MRYEVRHGLTHWMLCRVAADGTSDVLAWFRDKDDAEWVRLLFEARDADRRRENVVLPHDIEG